MLMLMACAPTYRPGLHATPLFEHPEDLTAYGGASLGGLQGGVAYAPIEHLGVRGSVQTAGRGYTRLSAGVGGWMAGPFYPELPKDTGLRLGVWVDGAAGTTRASWTVSVNGGTPRTTTYSGRFWDLGGQALLAFEAPKVASGLSVRAAWFQVHHDETSDGFDQGDGVGRFFYAEPMLFTRFGANQLKVELQLGGSLPLWFPHVPGATGIALPVNGGIALVYER